MPLHVLQRHLLLKMVLMPLLSVDLSPLLDLQAVTHLSLSALLLLLLLLSC
jgi:hypothetical protein